MTGDEGTGDETIGGGTDAGAAARAWSLEDALTEIGSSPRGADVGAFFDFDGTLIHGYSVYAFAQDRIVRRQVGAAEAIRAARVGVEYALGRVGYDRLIGLAADAWKGRPTKELEELGERLFRDVLADRVYPEARALVAAHRERGHTVAITTSATYYQVAPIARALGIDNIVCQGLEAVDGILTGAVTQPTLWGAGKTMAARRFAFDHTLDFAASFFYADGDEDLALMSEIGRPRPTNPGKRLAAEAVARDWPILRFASRGTPALPVMARNVGGVLVAAPVATAAAAAGVWQRSRRRATNVATSLLPDVMLGLNAVRIETTGSEYLDGLRDHPAVIVARQRSRVDAFVVAKLLRSDCRLVVARELAQDPIVGTIGRLFEIEFAHGVDEADATRMRRYQALLERGTSVAFLVGSLERPDDVPALRSGPARTAAGAGVPILPIVVRDSNTLVTRRPPVVRPGTIHIDVRAPITVAPAEVDAARERIVAALA